MATTDYGVNAPEAVKLWSRKLLREALKRTQMSKFVGTDSDSLCQIRDDTSKSEGDRVTLTLRMQLTGGGRQGDNTQEGFEESLTTYTDNIFIDQLRHAVRSGGKMTEQRIPWSVREEARMGLQDWWSGRFDTWFFNQISGNTAETDTRYTGNQAALAPTTNNQIFAGVATAETNLSANASQTFSLAMIDACVLRARTLTPIVRPLNNEQEPGKHQYVMFISPEQHYDLRRTTNTLEWGDIQKAALSAKNESNNPLYTGAAGVYNGTVLHESYYLPSVTTGDTNGGYRAVFCGAQAASLAFGRGDTMNKMNWVEELFDYGNQLGVSAGCIAGLKKTVFNSADFATIVASTAISADAKAKSNR